MSNIDENNLQKIVFFKNSIIILKIVYFESYNLKLNVMIDI